MTVYEVITERILELLRQGTIPWRRPWRDAQPPTNLISGRPYRGINAVLLNAMPFSTPHWVTFRQAGELGGSVREGSKGCPVIFFRSQEDDVFPDAGLDEEQLPQRKPPVLRYYTVFNVEQCDGLAGPPAPQPERIPTCEAIVGGMRNRPHIDYGGDCAYYSPPIDAVRVPSRELFSAPSHYYGTLFHELVHSTGHESRLARKGVIDPVLFGSHEYSREELVAEMGASFLAGITGIDTSTLPLSSSYLAHWIRRLEGDARLIIGAGAEAQRAVDYIVNRV